jgi:4-amino-4-deoxy-L-arabinose transferase-like glycosyltransferase
MCPGRRAVLALLVLALGVRCAGVLATPGYRPVHDDRDYDRLACWVAEHGGPPDRAPPWPGPSTCAAPPPSPGARPTAYRPPAWPVVLGGIYAVAARVGVARWTAGRLAQAVIGTVVVALVGAVAAAVWGPGIAVPATGLAAVFVPLVLDGMTLISEPLFVAFELGAVLAVLRHRASGSGGLRWALLAGVALGLATLTRSTGPVLAIPLLLAARERATAAGWRALRAPAVLAAAAILVVVPWTLRNERVLHAFVPVSTETGPTLLGTYNPAALDSARCPGCWVLIPSRARFRALARRLRSVGEVARDRLSLALSARFVEQRPASVATVAWHNSVRLLELGGPARTRYTARTIDVPPGLALWGARELWAIALLAVIGVAACALRRAGGWLVALVLLLWLSTVLVQSETPRFRAPLDPFLVMLAAVGAAAAGRRLARAARRPR